MTKTLQNNRKIFVSPLVSGSLLPKISAALADECSFEAYPLDNRDWYFVEFALDAAELSVMREKLFSIGVDLFYPDPTSN